MSPMDIIWFFFIFSVMLQPVIKRRLLEDARVRMIRVVEKERKSRVILLVHRQETMSFLGFPLMRFINIEDSEEVIRAINLTDDNVPIDLVIHTPGGLVLAAYQIAKALKKHPAKVTVFVPHYAMSGGTLIALAADEIVMSNDAVLGPVDPQLGQLPAASIVEAVNLKGFDKVDDQTLILYDQARKSLKQMEEMVLELIEDKFTSKKQARELAHLLTQGTWTHDFPITYESAKTLGLNVSDNIPEKILQLMTLFPQPIQKQGGVEFLPGKKQLNGNR